jgi:hypothetical protein
MRVGGVQTVEETRSKKEAKEMEKEGEEEETGMYRKPRSKTLRQTHLSKKLSVFYFFYFGTSLLV